MSSPLLAVVIILLPLRLTIQQFIPRTCTGPVPTFDPLNCGKYYQCFLTDRGWVEQHFDCPSGGVWDKEYNACVEGTCEGFVAIPFGTTTTKPKSPTKAPPKPPAKVTTKKPRPAIASSHRPASSVRPGLYICPSIGTFPNPTDSTKYNICIVLKGRYYYYIHSCPPGACFDKVKKLCSRAAC